MEKLSLLSKEGWLKSFFYEYHSQKQVLSKFFLSTLILSNPIIDVIRRELRKITPDVKVSSEQIKQVILKEVLKRGVIEGDKADEAKKKINKVFSKISKSKITKQVEIAVDKDKAEIQNIDDKDVSL